jgi:predicted MPP superfamily phosphohydrolase
MTTETDPSESANDHEPARSRRSGLTRRILLGGLGLSGLVGSGTAAYATGVEPNSLVVTSYRPLLPRWPAGRPLSLSVIADLHAGGPNMAVPHIRRVVDTANELKSDVTVLLGDYIATHPFVTEHVPLNVWAGELGRLRAPLGVWAVMGNHDWWFGIAKVRRALADAGIPVLENRAVRLGQNGHSFWLAGLGDQLAHRLGRGRFKGVDDLPGTLSRVDTNDPVILLAHEPEIFPTVPEGVALTLAGHTHGGQVRVPVVSERLIRSYRTRFAYGHITERRRHMIVSGGLGTSIVPVRLGVPPEIVRVELGA